MILPFLTIAASPLGGRGVYTSEFIPANTTIEISPVLVLNPQERASVEHTELNNYIFEWSENLEACAVAFGYVSMYNHSYHSSCAYYTDFDHDEIRVTTIKDVQAGEELTINYNNDPNDTTPIWFDAQ